MKNLKNAFTLPEILITILLVGVVSAFMFNVMSHRGVNKNKALFRKAYYIIEREVSAMIMDEDNFPSEINGPKRLAYFDPSQSGKDGGGVHIFEDDNGRIIRAKVNTGAFFCQTFAASLNTVGPVLCGDMAELADFRSHGFGEDYESNDPSFRTNDGISWYITPNVICDPTDPESSAAGCAMINDDEDPECPTVVDEDSPLPYICVAFDVNGDCADRECGPNSLVYIPNAGEPDNQLDVEFADRGYVYVFWNGKIRVPRGQAPRYLNDVKVL